MNSDLAYFDMSHNIEIIHLNDSNEFENEINKQLEKKIEPMEPTFETLNLGNNENPCLIKIGSTRMDLKDLKDHGPMKICLKLIARISLCSSKKCLHGPMKICLKLIPR